MKKIPLTKGKFTFVDNNDYENLSKFKWCISKNEAVIARNKIVSKYFGEFARLTKI